MPKTANQLYRESGSEDPFKTWLEKEKSTGKFIYNQKLNEKINKMDNIGQHSFHSADGTGSNSVNSLANPALSPEPAVSKSILSTFSKRDAKMLAIGAGSGIVVFLIVKHFFHG